MIILISARQGAGKTTTAVNLCKKFGPVGAIRTRFAQPLYEMHDACRNILLKYGLKEYDYTMKDGNLLQLLGTEWARKHINENIWADILRNQIRSMPKNLIKIVEDVRFPNEFDAFDSFDEPVVKLRLTCPRDIRKQRAEMWRENENHASETSLDEHVENNKFDIYIDTSINSQEQVIEKLMSCLMAKGLSANFHKQEPQENL